MAVDVKHSESTSLMVVLHPPQTQRILHLSDTSPYSALFRLSRLLADAKHHDRAFIPHTSPLQSLLFNRLLSPKQVSLSLSLALFFPLHLTPHRVNTIKGTCVLGLNAPSPQLRPNDRTRKRLSPFSPAKTPT